MLDAGVEEMHRRLGLVDGESAARIAVTDTYRVARALEVYRSSGKKLSSFTVPASVRARWNFICVSVVRPRDELYRRIDARVDAMFDAGLIDEIRFLVRSGYNAEDPGMKAIGYREFFDHGDPLSILDSLPVLERVREAIKLDSRHYAKRQILFMKSLPGVMECPADDRDHLASLIKSFIMTH
jgi:tRNA dimethylallyltransferase